MTSRGYNVLIVVLVALLVFGCGTSRKSQTNKKTGKKEQVAKTVDTTKLVEVEDETVPKDEIVDVETPQPKGEEDDTEPTEEEQIDAPEDTSELLEPIVDSIISGDTVLVDPTPTSPDTIRREKDPTKIPADTTAKEAKDSVDIKQREAEAKKRAIFDEPKAPDKETSSTSTGPESKMIDFTADIMRPIKIGIGEDSTALNLLNNVVLYHNGAVITCDSAVRYSDKRMDCFKRVIINQGTTYAYGDKLVYNGEINEARVYAPIIKMVDKDAVLLTYKFTFNTKDKVGIYEGGGTMTQGENEMESQRGYYYVDTREIVGVDQVEVRNLEYSMKSDSVIYNLDTDAIAFFTTSHIWNEKKDILIADRGRYNNVTADYIFTKNSYVLTEDQEVWSDTLVYNSRTENAMLFRDIQIRDEEQNTISFGDYGEYWGDREEALLTLDAALLSYDPQEPDTLYMRSDSMFLYSFPYDTTLYKPDLGGEIDTIADKGRGERVGGLQKDVLEGEREQLMDSLGVPSGLPGLQIPQRDSMRIRVGEEFIDEREVTLADSVLNEAIDTLDALDTLRVGDVKQLEDDGKSIKQREKEAKAESKRLKTESNKLKAAERNAQIKAKIAAREAKVASKLEAKMAKQKLKESAKKSKKRKSRSDQTGQLTEERDVELGDQGEELGDSLLSALPDSLALEGGEEGLLLVDGELEEGQIEPQYNQDGELIVGATAEPESEGEPEKKQRMVRAYRNVRVFRTDFQAVCDSLVGFSKDTTMHLYIEPIMWSDDNQVTSEVMDIFMRNQEIYKVEFIGGDPFMSSEVDTTRYNQIKGKYMEAWFRNNDIIKHDVIGNGQMYYYMQDEETQDLLYFMVMECADMTFLIENRKMDRISWKGSPEYTIYPMDKIADDQEQFLPGFVWHNDLRPKKKEDVLTRIIRPSQRVEVQQLEEPLFPLTQSIMLDRDQMIQQGIWQDRNDMLSPQAQEYIHSLELE